MGWFVPMLAAIGGGSAATGAAIVATAAAATTSAVMTKQAGDAQAAQYKSQARQEADAGRQREIERRRDLLRALSSQNAEAGAMGVSMQAGTGKAAAANYDIQRSREDVLTDRVNVGRKRNVLLSAGKAASTGGKLGAAVSLLDSASSIGTAYGR